ncbi:MAG: amidohydrolase [candidate division WOR-3 bacterium]|nr:amidohydrolase [candidate division WOR-3 bacterium]
MAKTLRFEIQPDDVIDVHVHIGGPSGENETMYYWTDEFKQSLAFEGMKLVTKLKVAQVTGARYVSELFYQLKHSKYVDKAVLLALDQVYSEAGKLRKDLTNLYVANDYINHLCQIYPGFLFGCSVHPYSPDAMERLWHCAKNGAVLCKWLPSAQAIDPTHPLSVKFYHALAELKIPLLLHVGPEETIPSSLRRDDELMFNAASGKYGKNPGDVISLALDAGAMVILSHCATPLGELLDKNNQYWENIFKLILKRFKGVYAKTSLYADLSALCLPGRFKYMKNILPLAKEMPGNFLYGSDYPIPVVSFSDDKTMPKILKSIGWLAGRILPKNDFDKNYQLLKQHFLQPSFTNAVKVLRNPNQPLPDLSRFLKRFGKKKRGKGFSIGRLIKPLKTLSKKGQIPNKPNKSLS